MVQIFVLKFIQTCAIFKLLGSLQNAFRTKNYTMKFSNIASDSRIYAGRISWRWHKHCTLYYINTRTVCTKFIILRQGRQRELPGNLYFSRPIPPEFACILCLNIVKGCQKSAPLLLVQTESRYFRYITNSTN